VIRLILIDIDGTLIGEDATIHPSTYPALERARKAGIHLGIATGRPGFGVALEFARVVSENDLHIFNSGATISKPEQKAVFTADLPRSAYLELVAISRREAVPLEVYTEDEFYLEREDALVKHHAEHLHWTPKHQDLLALEGHIVRVQWVVHESVWEKFHALTKVLPDLEISPATAPWSPGTVFASITKTGSSKLGAAKWLANHYGFSLENVMMVGDADNDVELIAGAGYGVAMGNGSVNAKAVAKKIVANVDQGGLAEAIDLALQTL
jgi:Cof subfamily protein (haloacid dehalogenase superfamily)